MTINHDDARLTHALECYQHEPHLLENLASEWLRWSITDIARAPLNVMQDSLVSHVHAQQTQDAARAQAQQAQSQTQAQSHAQSQAQSQAQAQHAESQQAHAQAQSQQAHAHAQAQKAQSQGQAEAQSDIAPSLKMIPRRLVTTAVRHIITPHPNMTTNTYTQHHTPLLQQPLIVTKPPGNVYKNMSTDAFILHHKQDLSIHHIKAFNDYLDNIITRRKILLDKKMKMKTTIGLDVCDTILIDNSIHRDETIIAKTKIQKAKLYEMIEASIARKKILLEEDEDDDDEDIQDNHSAIVQAKQAVRLALLDLEAII